MKKHFARIVSIALAFTLALLTPGIIPVKAFSGDYDYGEENGEIIIYEYLGSDSAVVIPETIDGKPVAYFGYGVFYSGVTSVTIPKSVKRINYYVFAYAVNLEEIIVDEENPYFSSQDGVLFNKTKKKLIVYPRKKAGSDYTIPDSVAKIDTEAFAYSNNLQSITIPSNVKTIGIGAFYNTGLASVTIEEGLIKIGHWAFEGCRNLATINIPEGVVSIGDCAFFDCRSLNSINIPSSVETIGYDTFSNCTSLTGAYMAEGLVTIWDYAFCNCTALTSINIPESVESIGSSAFIGCSNLVSVTMPDTVTSIGDDAFYQTPWLYNYSVPGGFVVEGNGILIAYKGTEEEVTIPDGVTRIGAYAFSDAPITQVIIPDSVTSIGNGAFSHCTALAGIDIPQSVVSIESRVFYDCWSLSSVTIPDSVTSIGYDAFYGTPWLDDYTDNNGFVIVGDGILIGYTGSDTVLNIPDGVTQIVEGTFEYGPYTEVNIPGSVKRIGDYAFYECMSLTSVVMDEGVESIGEGAFSYCENLLSVTIPDTVTDIGCDAFYDTEWISSASDADGFVIAGNGILIAYNGTDTVADIPEGVTRIAEYAFYDAQCIQINIPEGVTRIENGAFYECRMLTGISIPASVESIGDYAFEHCIYLSSLIIPSGVTSIGYHAFDECFNLTNVFIPGSVTSMGEEMFVLCYTTTIYGNSGSSAQTYAENEGIVFEIALATVTFDSQGGSAVGDVISEWGLAITEPAAPTKEGYAFGGWYTDSACATAWDFAGDKVTDDITLYAKWTIRSYTVTFDSQGGSAVSGVTADYDTAITEPAAPTKEGYTFGGWYTDSACATAWDFAGDKVTGDTTLYAKWTKDEKTPDPDTGDAIYVVLMAFLAASLCITAVVYKKVKQ